MWAYLLHLDAQTEVVYLGQLHHPNLVKLIGYCLEDEQRLLVYEFMPRGCLENHLFRSKAKVFLAFVSCSALIFFCLSNDIFVGTFSINEQGVLISNHFLGAFG